MINKKTQGGGDVYFFILLIKTTAILALYGMRQLERKRGLSCIYLTEVQVKFFPDGEIMRD